MGVAGMDLELKIWLYLNNEQMEWTNILHAGANWGKLKVDSIIFGWVWSKMVVACQFRRPWCILRINIWIELIFWMLIVMQFLVRLISSSTCRCWGSSAVVSLTNFFDSHWELGCNKWHPGTLEMFIPLKKLQGHTSMCDITRNLPGIKPL